MKQIKVLFVCTGNICRSPTAEGVFNQVIANMNATRHFLVDSAGTHAYHVGEPPDSRAQEVALSRGVDLSAIRARKITPSDFVKFDHILAMDSDNYQALLTISPDEYHHKIAFFLDYATHHDEQDVPDPYFGGRRGFNYVFDLVEDAAKGFYQATTQ